jgi:hypothetical protein
VGFQAEHRGPVDLPASSSLSPVSLVLSGGESLRNDLSISIRQLFRPEELVADLGPDAIAGTKQQAAECDVVILATRWVSVPDALKGIDWKGRILIDATNAHMDPVPDTSLAGVTKSRSALNGRTSSEMVAETAVGARLVKSISNIPMDWIQDFSPTKPRTVIFTSGDDIEAKKLVIELINSTGLVAIDLGSLVKGGAMHEVGAPLSGLDLHFVRRLR